MSKYEGCRGTRNAAESDPSWESLRPRVIAEIPNINYIASPVRERRGRHLLAWLDEKLVYKRLLTTSLVAVSFFLVGLCGGLLVSMKPTVKYPMPQENINFVVANKTRPEETATSFNNGNWSNQANTTPANPPLQQKITAVEKQQAIEVLSQPVVRSDSSVITPFPTLGLPLASERATNSYPDFPNEQLVSKPVNPPAPSGSSTYLQQESFGWNNLSLDIPAPSPASVPTMMASTQTTYQIPPQQATPTPSASIPVSATHGFVGYSNVGVPVAPAPISTNTSPTSTINSTMSQPMYESPTRGW